MLWAPQAERGWVHSNQEEQESGELWGCHWRGGACAVDPGVQQDCWSQGTGSSSGGAHRTGWCEFKDLQAACSPDRRWGSTSTEQSGRLSTVLCMVLLIRTVTSSLQLQRGGGGRYSVEIMENTWHHLRIKGSQETSCYRRRPSVLPNGLLSHILPRSLKEGGRG